jgi:pyruvate formate lyase activating enzyme
MMNGMAVTLEVAAEELRKYRHGLKIMSGGFTLSGGEPLMQDRFAVKLLTAAQAMGIHTAVETNGFLGSRLSDEELEKIDLVLLGIKTWDPEKHRRLTGKDIEPTLEFARRLATRNRPIWVRFVLVPGLTDDAQDLRQMAQFIASLRVVERVEVLPFHQLGRFKWRALGLDYTLENTKPPSPDLIEMACGIFRAEGLKAF